MASGDVPAWAAVAGAGISGAAGFAGAVVTGLWARDTERDRLRQERELHGARDRVRSLEKAIATASRYREELAAALRWLGHPDGRGEPPEEALWRWTAEVQQEVKGHESALKLRFGVGPVTECWEFWEWSLAEAVFFCESNKPVDGNPRQAIGEDVRSGALDRRASTRQAIESFISVAGGAMVANPAPLPLKEKPRFLRRRPGS